MRHTEGAFLPLSSSGGVRKTLLLHLGDLHLDYVRAKLGLGGFDVPLLSPKAPRIIE